MNNAPKISTISFVGAGNVATQLAIAFDKAGFTIGEVCSGSRKGSKEFSQQFNCAMKLNLAEMEPGADLYLICVPDDKVGEVAGRLPDVNGIVAHTSGMTPLESLNRFQHFGVFYPLQTLSKMKTVDHSEIPFCIEGGDEETSVRLEELASVISTNVSRVDSEKRKYLHLAAVFVNNFSNHLFSAADELLKDKGLDFELLLPLIKETASKIESLKPDEAQTGPAVRNDESVIGQHLEMLKNYPGYRELYKMITEQLTKKYHG